MNRCAKFFLVLPLVLTGCGTAGSTPGTTVSASLDPLQLQIAADRTQLAPGEPVTVTTTISNPNPVPVNLYLGHSHCGNNFTTGSTLQSRSVATKGWDDRRDVLKADWKIGFCGTGSYAMVVAVPAKGSIKYSARGKLKVGDKGPYLNFGSGEQDYLVLPFSGAGKFLVRASHAVTVGHFKSVDPDDARWLPKEHSIENGYAPDAKAPYFEGTLNSNEVTVAITLAAK
jgi:hypothetical protein